MRTAKYAGSSATAIVEDEALLDTRMKYPDGTLIGSQTITLAEWRAMNQPKKEIVEVSEVNDQRLANRSHEFKPAEDNPLIHDYSTGDLPADDEPQWTPATLQEDFSVLGFAAPYVVVERRSDHKRGLLQFNHSPRVYWGFVNDEEVS